MRVVHYVTGVISAIVGLLSLSVAACGSTPKTSTPAAPVVSSRPVIAAGSGARVAPSAGVAGVGAAPVVGASTPPGPVPGDVATAGMTGAAGSSAGASSSPTAAAGGAPAMAAAGTALPCAVSQALSTNCAKCHGATPIGGAPMSLVTYADLTKPAATMSSFKVYELMKMRLHDQARPMPPGGKISAADMSTLDNWISAGAQPAAATEGTCADSPTTMTPVDDPSALDGSSGPLVAEPGETCYNFWVHQSTSQVDETPYDVGMGEHYEQFYYKAPWPDGYVATRFGGDYDNVEVLHHWLLFSTLEDEVEGYHFRSDLPTLLGVNAQLLAGWAVGGTNTVMPKDVGFELPPKGSQLNIQWHFYNSTGKKQVDHSAVQICAVPKDARPHTATVTWLGTEDLGGNKWFGGVGMPPHQVSTFSGTCAPLREGMSSSEPIHLIGFTPHMHRLGTRTRAIVNHQDGTKEVIFDKPFDFNEQIHYTQFYDLMPGDTITAECEFNNTTSMGVPFGESSDTEMCYLFTMSWPAHGLENHVLSLIGATNTCW